MDGGLSVVEFEALFRQLPTAYLVMDADLVIVDANDAYVALLGRSRDALVGRPVFEAFPPTEDAVDDRGRNTLQVSFERARDSGQIDVMPLYQYDVADPGTGEIQERYWSLVSAPLLSPYGRTEFVLQRVEDITDWMHVMAGNLAGEPTDRILAVEAELFGRVQELRAARAAEQAAITALQTSEVRAQAVLDTAADAIVVTDGHGVVVSTNPAAERLFGRFAAELTGSPLSRFLAPADALQFNPAVARPSVPDPRSAGPGEVVGFRSDGSTVPVEITVGAVPGLDLTTIVLRDITQRKLMEQQLEHERLHDPLTGLANRTLLIDRLEHARARRKRQRGLLAVLFIDLDRFKAVNDTWGHLAGDQLLAITATRLRHTLRAEDLASRWGGDEFVVLCEDITGPADADVIAGRIATALSTPVQLAECVINPTASIGSVVDDGTCSVDQLIAFADRSMYRHKSRER